MLYWPAGLIVPDLMPVEVVVKKGIDASRIRRFPGLKEELYVCDTLPNDDHLDDIGIDRNKTIVLLRASASMAHYHVAKGERLLRDIVRSLGRRDDLAIILVPRTGHQRVEMAAIPERAGECYYTRRLK